MGIVNGRCGIYPDCGIQNTLKNSNDATLITDSLSDLGDISLNEIYSKRLVKYLN